MTCTLNFNSVLEAVHNKTEKVPIKWPRDVPELKDKLIDDGTTYTFTSIDVGFKDFYTLDSTIDIWRFNNDLIKLLEKIDADVQIYYRGSGGYIDFLKKCE